MDLNRVLRRGETTKIYMDALAKEGPLPAGHAPACPEGYPGQGAVRVRQGVGADRGAPGCSDASDARSARQGRNTTKTKGVSVADTR